MINEKAITSAKICSVDKKSFERAVKCPTCNALVVDASVDDDIVTCEGCGSMKTECTSTLLANIVVNDTDSSEKFYLLIDYAVLQKYKVELGK